ncbi:hypothetical protein EVAR_69742_1 [Eumeta japonica]|uniref:Uncharacterized protein n=1 Tax=Eumeta variegata TaxID=151549 RepID=A0A4C2A5C8_EUMVA|nr:hypothetical protein EVAR_69742_1 [Eumeta japonica]
MDIPYVSTDVTTDDNSSLLLCFGTLTLGINRARLAFTADAFVLTCSTCCLKLSRASIITPKYRIYGCDVISCSQTCNLIVSALFLLEISTPSVLYLASCKFTVFIHWLCVCVCVRARACVRAYVRVRVCEASLMGKEEGGSDYRNFHSREVNMHELFDQHLGPSIIYSKKNK